MQDAQGNALSGATASAAASYDAAIRALTLSYGNPLDHFDAAIKAAPAFAMAHLGRAWALAGANDALLIPGARVALAAANAVARNERERMHAAALAHAVEGHRASATRILDQLTICYPHDLLAHFAAMLLDAFQGRFPWVAARSARAIPQWSKDQPSYGIMLAFYGFGLEEACDYARAEVLARTAAELEPHGYWPHHAVSHVLEMTGRPEEGLAWMDQRAQFWSTKDHNSRVHIWWHKALFHLELGQYDMALGIYDKPIHDAQRPLGIVMTNASALLWRLETLGAKVGERWAHVAALWEGHADGKLCVFTDVHAAMAEIGAGQRAALERRLALMRRTAADGTEKAPGYRDIGVPVVEGFAAFHDGDYAQCARSLVAGPIRSLAARWQRRATRCRGLDTGRSRCAGWTPRCRPVTRERAHGGATWQRSQPALPARSRRHSRLGQPQNVTRVRHETFARSRRNGQP